MFINNAQVYNYNCSSCLIAVFLAAWAETCISWCMLCIMESWCIWSPTRLIYLFRHTTKFLFPRLDHNEVLEDNQRNLLTMTNRFFLAIIDSSSEFPPQLRSVCHCLFQVKPPPPQLISQSLASSVMCTVLWGLFQTRIWHVVGCWCVCLLWPGCTPFLYSVGYLLLSTA